MLEQDENADPMRLTRPEWGLLLVLAAVQLTHILDFVIIMPLGPKFVAAYGITPQQFSWMVSAYGFAASLSGLLAASFLDRFDRKNALLFLYAGFIVGTFFCAAAPNFPLLVAARAVAGGFAGVLAANVLAVVGDVFPDVRRGTAMGVLMSAFSVASILGVPAGLYLAELAGWRLPFFVLVGVSLGVLLQAWRVLPPLRHHLAHAGHGSEFWAVLSNPRHLRAFALMIALVTGSFSIVPYLSLYLVNNVGLPESQLGHVWLCGGIATLVTMIYVGRLSDRHGKLRVFRIIALFTLIPTLLVTHLPRTTLVPTLAATTLFMVATSGRMVPAIAMITGSALPRYRGSFMSINACVQHLAMSVAPIIAGRLLDKSEGNEPLVGFGAVGYLAVTAMLASIYLAGRLRPVEEEAETEARPAVALAAPRTSESGLTSATP
jgi:predicted MFS family arabinose efflux permease